MPAGPCGEDCRLSADGKYMIHCLCEDCHGPYIPEDERS